MQQSLQNQNQNNNNNQDEYVKEAVLSVESTEELKVFTRFEDLNLKPDLMRGIFGHGFEFPSQIQQMAIHPIINKRDILAQAQSGTGKTGTFTISTFQLINENENSIQSLILSPTKELAQQTLKVFQSIGQFLPVKILLCVGGTEIREMTNELRSGGIQVVVGTPGRVQDLMLKNKLNIEKLKFLVLDEADLMLSQGFIDSISQIFTKLPPECQIALFSATMPPKIIELSKQFLRNPAEILVKKENLTLDGIKQFFIKTGTDEQKKNVIITLLEMLPIQQAIIYCNKKESIDGLTQYLQAAVPNIVMSQIHGEMDKSVRDLTMLDFREGKTRILISTDLLARGIDVQTVNLVINFDIPRNMATYIHRIGRTGRHGRAGVAINFVIPDDAALLGQIEQFYQTRIDELPQDLASIQYNMVQIDTYQSKQIDSYVQTEQKI